jgi:Tfp pilus assembly protein FimT
MAGASLVELMIVVGIIAAISAMAVANMPRMSLDMRISRAALTYTALLREARGRAMANRSFTRVVLDYSGARTLTLSEKSCPFGAFNSAAANCTAWSEIRVYSFDGEDLRNVETDADLTTIFTPRGLLQSGSGTIRFSASTRGDALRQNVRITSKGWVEKL